MPLLPALRLHEIRDEVARATQPATHLERWLANQAAYASWELERVRANKDNESAEPRLNAAYSRAARNWNRARKELQAVQTARVNHATLLKTTREKAAAATPLADPGRAPQPKLAGPMANHLLQLIGAGAVKPSAIGITAEQEAR